MTTPIWLTGFEHGVMSANGGGICFSLSGSPAVVATTKRTGNYALQALVSGAAASCHVNINVAGSPTVIVGRFYFLWHTAPGAATRIFRITTDTTGAAVQFDPADHTLNPYAGSAGTKSAPLTQDVWYQVDFKYNCAANPHTLDIQVNGSPITQKTNAIAATWINGLWIGFGDNATGEVYYDDIVVSLTAGDYPIGAGVVEALLPNADGAHNNAANTMEDAAGNDIDGASHLAWQQLDELPMSESTNRIQQSTAGTDKYAEVAFADVNPYTVFHGISGILAYMSATATANEGACVIRRSDGTEITLWGSPAARADYSESSMFYKSSVIAPPAGGWTPTEINALVARLGYSNDVSPVPYWENLLIEVASSGVIALAPDDAAQAQTAEGVSLVVTLAVDDAAQAQAAEAVTLTQTHIIAVDDASQAQAADNITFAQTTGIEVQAAEQAQTAEEVTLTQTHIIEAQAAYQAQAADRPTLTQTHYILVAAAHQAQTADRVVLSNPTRDLWNIAAQAHGFTTTMLAYATDDPIPPGLTMFALARALYQTGMVTSPGEPTVGNAEAWAEAITG